MARRQGKCRQCGKPFTPINTLQKTCPTPACAIAEGKALRAKQERKALRERKRALKTRSDVLKEAQAAFNAYIRERDRFEPCVSCGTHGQDDALRGGYWDCGHYRSTGANPELRFCELNAAKQCHKCNRYLSGNVTNFRIGLRGRIGDEALEWLEGPHESKRYSKANLEAIRDEYRRKRRELEKRHGDT